MAFFFKMFNLSKFKNFNFSSGLALLMISLFLLFDIRSAEFSDVTTGEGVVGPKTAPTFLNIGIICLSILLIISSFSNKNSNEKLENIDLTLILKKVLLILIAFLYLFLTNFIGYLTSTLLIIPLILYIFENKNFKKNLVISISGALIYYIFFIKVLGLHNPDPYYEIFNIVSF